MARGATKASAVQKRSITVAGHRTSISLERPFWEALGEIAEAERKPLAALVAAIDRGRAAGTNLSSAVRLFVLDRRRAGPVS